MGKYVFRLPDIGEGIAEAEIVAWHVRVGDQVEEDGRLADMMTDKATVEMESPVAGRIVQVAGEVGDVIAIGSPLVVIETEGDEVAEEVPARQPEVVAEPKPEPEPEASLPEPSFQSEIEVAPAPQPLPENSSLSGGALFENELRSTSKVLASPAVRARAKELGIDLGEVRPAEDGRIRHADLDAFIAYNAAGGFRPAGRVGKDELVKVIGLRRRIAENMAASKRHIPHFSYVEECDVTALEQARTQTMTIAVIGPS